MSPSTCRPPSALESDDTSAVPASPRVVDGLDGLGHRVEHERNGGVVGNGAGRRAKPRRCRLRTDGPGRRAGIPAARRRARRARTPGAAPTLSAVGSRTRWVTNRSSSLSLASSRLTSTGKTPWPSTRMPSGGGFDVVTGKVSGIEPSAARGNASTGRTGGSGRSVEPRFSPVDAVGEGRAAVRRPDTPGTRAARLPVRRRPPTADRSCRSGRPMRSGRAVEAARCSASRLRSPRSVPLLAARAGHGREPAEQRSEDRPPRSVGSGARRRRRAITRSPRAPRSGRSSTARP